MHIWDWVERVGEEVRGQEREVDRERAGTVRRLLGRVKTRRVRDYTVNIFVFGH